MEVNSKARPIIIFIAIFLGFLLSFNSKISEFSSYLEEPLLSILLFFIFSEIKWKDLKKAFNNRKFLLITILINFVWTPFLAVLLGRLFLTQDLTLQIALLMILVLPCTDWYLVFTDYTGGNTALSSALLPINLILQLVLLPVYLKLAFGLNELVHTEFIFSTLASIILPLILALAVKLILSSFSDSSRIKNAFYEIGDHIEIVLISIIALAINAAHGQELFDLPRETINFIIVLFLFYVINFIIGISISKKLKYGPKESISLVYLITSRNTPLSLALAGIIFPTNSLLSLILLIGPFSEIPISFAISFLLKGIYKLKD